MIAITVTCITLNDSACMEAIIRVLLKITTNKFNKLQPNVCVCVGLSRGRFVGYSVSGLSLGWSVGNDNNSAAKIRCQVSTLVEEHTHTHTHTHACLLHGAQSFLRS
jgi:hypothetical protein